MALPSRRGKSKGKEPNALVFLSIFGAVLIAIPLAFYFLVGPKAETYPVPGPMAAFDPVASLPQIAGKVGAGFQLVGFDLTSVKADGTLDLTANYDPKPTAVYRFERVENGEAQSTPVPQGATASIQTEVEAVTVRIGKPGDSHTVTQTTSGSSYGFVSEGMDFSRSEPVKRAPTAPIDISKPSLAKMWELAKNAGAKPDAVASAKFSNALTEFVIEGTNIQFRWLPDGSFHAPQMTSDERERLESEM
jgi:hypothetical protein